LSIHHHRPGPVDLHQAFGVDFVSLLPHVLAEGAPVEAGWVRIEPGQSADRHAHFERELLFVAQGRGEIHAEGERTEITAEDTLFVEGGTEHRVTNTGAEAMLLLSVYWLDARTGRALDAPIPAPRRLLVTAAPPTPNGDLHLGHLSGPYLAADVITRFERLQGVDVRFVTGTDDNQSYVEVAGRKLGSSPQEAADFRAARIEAAMQAADLGVDAFVRPNASGAHRAMVERVFASLREKGLVERRRSACLHCDRCDTYLFEAHVWGLCPSCKEPTGGNSCEPCSRPNDCVDLGEPRCTRCDGPATTAEVERWVFPLARHASELEAYHRSLRGLGARTRELCQSLLEDGLRDVAVTHPARWGIPATDTPGQTFYVWFEMAARYLAYPAAVPGFGDPFHDGDDDGVVQCFGFDNAFFYTILLPALMRAADPGVRLPRAMVVNEFYRLEGQKFSTSRGHAVWVHEAFDPSTSDVLRSYLCRSRPERHQTDFREGEALRATRVLADLWEGWFAELQTRLERHRRAAPCVGEWTHEHTRFLQTILRAAERVADSLSFHDFRPSEAVLELDRLVHRARAFGRENEHWLARPSQDAQARTAMALELSCALAVAIMVSPIQPRLGQAMYAALGHEGPITSERWPTEPRWIAAGTHIGAMPTNLSEGYRALELRAAARTARSA